ncbi:MAG: FHA domain-containing protein, partial [Planctomycetales bacterium]|nr:FHA domain-containing protein [Planctomycetales bacterium]
MSDSSLTLPPHPDDSGASGLPLAGDPSGTGDGTAPVAGVTGAYLVLQSAGRWSDVFRLTAPSEVILGRSSSNDIAIRSERASRQHARVWSTADGWMIEDLGSRNGTIVGGKKIAGPVKLADGDKIEIAGFSLQFVHQIQTADGPIASPLPAGATEDHLTMAMDAASITDRRSKSEYLHGDPLGTAGGGTAGGMNASFNSPGLSRQGTASGARTVRTG